MESSAKELVFRQLDGLELGTPDSLSWNNMVANNAASGFMQSIEWAQFKHNQGLRHVRLGIYLGSELLAGCIFYYAADSNPGFLVSPHGPILPWQNQELARKCLGLIIGAAEQLAKEEGLIGLRIEPLLPVPVPDLLLEFGRSPIDLLPKETLCLDLTQSLDEILAQMKPKGRYNTRLSARNGVTVRSGTISEMIDKFYPILDLTARRDHFKIEPPAFFIELANTLMNNKLAQLLIAEHEGEIVGAIVQIIFGSTSTYLYGAITNDKRQLMTGYALQWQAIQQAKAAGCSQYDLYGFDQFCSPNHPYGRFSKFKSQFGGTVKRYCGAQDYYFMDELADALIKVFQGNQEEQTKA
ncbi:MAG: peptidoglycan bridge formation glycyltransferase FemA/FemB family protein [Candidatus Obscuribacterales bacterium]|jgi:lipid II:glycine glycyltransferase (peptidoglycan interpeptide bridge formation enzyme)